MTLVGCSSPDEEVTSILFVHLSGFASINDARAMVFKAWPKAKYKLFPGHLSPVDGAAALTLTSSGSISVPGNFDTPGTRITNAATVPAEFAAAAYVANSPAPAQAPPARRPRP